MLIFRKVGRDFRATIIQSEATFPNSRCTAFPIIPLVVSEDEVIAIKVVHNPIHPAVARNMIHLSMAAGSLTFERFDLEQCIQVASSFVFVGCLCLEQSDGETSRLEDVHDMLYYFSGLAAFLTGRYVGFKGGIRTVWLWSNMYSEIMCSSGAIWGRNDSIGREATGCEEIGIDAC